MVTNPPPAPGSTFGPYRLDSVISHGRTGVLYVATDQRLGRPVALKVVVGTLAASPDFVERFQREAATLARLESPHVVQIFDHGVHDGLPFIATQYAAGGDLGALVARLGPMPLPMAAQAVSQVAEALRDAHRAGVVHRNLKPRNVLLRDERLEKVHVLVTDFGVGPGHDSNVTEPASAPGAWNYLPPERLEGGEATEAGDVYAAGCLLHEMITGRPPYSGTDVEVAMAHLQSPVPRLEGTDDATRQLNDVLTRTMAKDPAERGSAEELRGALRAIAGILSAPPAPAPSEAPTMLPGAMPPPPPPPARPPAYQSLSVPQAPAYAGAPPSGPGQGSSGGVPRTWLVAGVAAVLALVVGVGVAIAATSGDDDPDDPAPSETAASSDAPPTASAPTAPEPSTAETSDAPPAPIEPVLEGAIRGDLDGDGLGDLAGLSLDGLIFFGSTGSGFAEPVLRKNLQGQRGVMGDLDGDDTVDVVRFLEDPPRMTASTSVKGAPVSPLATPDSPAIISGSDVATCLGDVDGDGNLDLVLTTPLSKTKSQIDVALGTGDGAFGATSTWYTGQIDLQDKIYAVDVDDDGLADVVKVDLQTEDDPQVNLLKSDGTSFTETGEPTPEDIGYGSKGFEAADIDGDGKEELVQVGSGGPKLSVYEWNGTSFDQVVWFDETDEIETPILTNFTFSDVNGDGFDDFVSIRQDDNGYSLVVYTSDGTTFAYAPEWDVKVGDEVGFGAGLLAQSFALR